MAHPYRSAAHKNDPKWIDGVRRYADGGTVTPPQAPSENYDLTTPEGLSAGQDKLNSIGLRGIKLGSPSKPAPKGR